MGHLAFLLLVLVGFAYAQPVNDEEKLELAMRAQWHEDHPGACYGCGMKVDPCETTKYGDYTIPPHQHFGNGWRLPLLDPASLCHSCPPDEAMDWPQAPEMRGEPEHERTWGQTALRDGGLWTMYYVGSGTATQVEAGKANCEWDAQHMTRRNAMLRRCFGEIPQVEHGYAQAVMACRPGKF
jgi:hypothetical protein